MHSVKPFDRPARVFAAALLLATTLPALLHASQSASQPASQLAGSPQTATTAAGAVTATATAVARAQTYRTIDNVSYLSEAELQAADAYRREQCTMDLYLPENSAGFPTLIWFHGGGLTQGKRYMPDLKSKGYGLVSVSYRLSPKADLPAFIEDAAAATAWVIQHIAQYGGDPQKVFIGGHSAGGYLAAMVGMDAGWLAPYGIANTQLAGIIPVSAQVTTHFEVKKLRGDTGHQLRPLVDSYAPLYHVSADLPPICIIVGDRNLEWPARVEENDLLAATLRRMNHPLTEFYEVPDKNHGTIVGASWALMPAFIEKVLAQQGAATQAVAP